MNKVNIFEREVSVFGGIYDKEEPINCTLKEVLEFRDIQGEINKYRKSKNNEDKLKLPIFMPSGIFKNRGNEGLIKHNNVVCIDIDKKHNLDVENFDEIPILIRLIPYVAYCGHSCGGEGYFVLLPIEDAKKHKEHYKSICDDFEKCGITVDKQCLNVSRSRIFSYDDEAYYNYEAAVYTRTKEDLKGITRKKEEITDPKKQSKYGIIKDSIFERIEFEETKRKVEFIIEMISKNKIDVTKDYHDWYKIAAALVNQFGEDDGRKYFHQICCHYPKYDERDCDDKFDSCMNLTEIGIGTFFRIAKEYGVSVW